MSVTSSCVKLFHSVVLWQFAQISILAFTNLFLLIYVSVSHTVETGQEQRPCYLLHKIQCVVGSNKCLLIQHMIQVSSYRLIFRNETMQILWTFASLTFSYQCHFLRILSYWWGEGTSVPFYIAKWFREGCSYGPSCKEGPNQLPSSTAHLALAKVCDSRPGQWPWWVLQR